MTLQTISQTEKAARESTGVRIYHETWVRLLHLQANDAVKTGSKPSHADLMERAVAALEREIAKQK
jgi:hypothetical protein